MALDPNCSRMTQQPPYTQQVLTVKGLLTTPWMGFFNWLTLTLAKFNLPDLAGNLANYNATQYANRLFFGIDSGVTYLSRTSYSVVSVSGVSVFWISGDSFPTGWIGTEIVILGVNYTVATVASATLLTLTAAPPALSSAALTQLGYQWYYAAGSVTVASLAALPTGLGVADAGLLVYDLTLEHAYRWNGVAWSFAPNDDHMAGQISASAGGLGPLGGVWQLCNGATVLVSKGDGTTVNVTTPNLLGDVALKGAVAQSAQQAAAAATWDAAAVTGDESAHTHPITVTGANLTNVTVGPAGVFGAPAQSIVSGAGSAHHHALTNANAKLNAPSEANGGLGLRIALVWYMRR